MERLLREGVPGNVVVEPELKRELSWSYQLPLELVLRAQGSDPPPTGFGRTLNRPASPAQDRPARLVAPSRGHAALHEGPWSGDSNRRGGHGGRAAPICGACQ